MVVLIIILILLLLFTGLLCLPTKIVADTDRKQFYVSIPFYFKAMVSGENEIWSVRIRVFLIPFKIKTPFLKKKSFNKKNKSEKKNIKKRRKMNTERLLQLLKRTIKSFKIKRLMASVDTGDFPLNAQLIPVVSQIKSENISIGINFNNDNSFFLRVDTRLYKLTWIIIRYIIF